MRLPESCFSSHAADAFSSVQFSVACLLIFTSTFIPNGAFSLNPTVIGRVPETPRPASELKDRLDDNSDTREAGRENLELKNYEA